MSTHTCPHGARYHAVGGPPLFYCGEEGWLCDMCKSDRADRRNRELVEGMALAGLLANPASCLTGTEVGKEVGKMGWEVQAGVAIDAVRALRDEQKGETE